MGGQQVYQKHQMVKKSMKNCWRQQKYHMMFESNNITDLQWGVLRPNWRSGSKIKAGAGLQPTQIVSYLWKTLGGSRERVIKG